ncbi:unnamed protein product [Cunninghamella echinulata]
MLKHIRPTTTTLRPFYTTTTSSIRYVSTQSSNATSSNNTGDTRIELVRRVLFESPQRPTMTIPLEGEALQQHETIERAWKLHKMRERESRQRTLEKQFRSLH